MELEREAVMEAETQVAMEVATQVVMERETQVAIVGEAQRAMEREMQVVMEAETQVAIEVATQVVMERETQVAMVGEAQRAMEGEMQVAMEREMQVVMEAETQVAMEAAMEGEAQRAMEGGAQVAMEGEMQVVMEGETQVAMEDVPQPSPPFSPIPAMKKMRRLRKVRETEIKEIDEVDEVGVVVKKSSDGDERLECRETAEEILKRFGKSGDAGCEGVKKRKVVQSTIMTAVVDMMKQVEVVPVQEVVRVNNVEAEDGELAIPSQGEEIATGLEGMAPLSKRKRSNTVTRCSAHATALTFESAAHGDDSMGIDDFENAPVIDGDINKEDEDGSNSENGNIGNGDMEDGEGAPDSEKGNEGNDDAEDRVEGLNCAWSDGWAGEGLSMDSILEKARQMVAQMSNPGLAKEKKKPSEEALTVRVDQNGKKKMSKKEEERIKREELYAESQRLLRESKGVTFVAPAPVIKPVSSVLEKIRQRRLQLGCSGSGSASSSDVETKVVSRRVKKEKSSTYVDLTVDGDTEVKIEIFSSNVAEAEEVKPEEVAVDMAVPQTSTQEVLRGKEDVDIPEADGEAQNNTACDGKSPGTPEGQTELFCDDLTSRRLEEEDSKLEPSPSILVTQDLLCTSQLSPATQESVDAAPFESVVAMATDFMGLDTQLDEELMRRPLRDDHHLQNNETGSSKARPSDQSEVYTAATHVRGLIDDEAEDEDEDILAENAEEEEVLEDEDDLQDLIATAEKEKAGDKARRDALHRKWLEQQDTEQTEDILERLRTGRSTRWKGRDRVVSCLDEDDDIVNLRDSESLDKISLDSQTGADGPFAEEDHIEEPSISLGQRTRSQELEMDCLLDEYEDNEDLASEKPVIEDEIIEDEEEHEQSIIRKRLLEESEEQLDFMSPADDESSREVLNLINKVNVGSVKAKSTTGYSDIRGLGSAPSSSLPSKPSFLGRNSSSSSLPPPAHRQVGSGGGSRSFVFGRDDSNSGHGFPSNQPQEEKEPVVAKSAPDKGVSSTSVGRGKKRPAPQSMSGPSLFEMLKKQSKEHDQDLKSSASAISKKWSSNTEAFSIFATKKPFAPSRRKL